MPFFGQFRVYRSQAVRLSDSAIGTHRAARIFPISIGDDCRPFVSEFLKILNWINSTTAGSSVIRDGTLVIGNPDLQIRYRISSGRPDPMDFMIADTRRLAIITTPVFEFHPPRRIGFSPFLYFYGHHPQMNIRCVDFYRISGQKSFIRIFCA